MISAAQGVFLAVSVVVLFLFAGASPRFVDDTFITLQYSRNFVETGTISWHPTLPAVDGFTSLGHVLAISFGHWLGLELITWNSILNIGAAIGILAMFAWAARSLSAFASFAGLALIASNTSLLFWVGAGLDAVPYMATFFAAYLTSERTISNGYYDGLSALTLVALALMRPEGLFIALALLVAFWASRIVRPIRRNSVSLFWTMVVLATIAAQVFWRVAEFGHPLPNTYYAKTSQSLSLEVLAGFSYLTNWFSVGSGLLVCFSLGALAAGSRAYLRALFIIGQTGAVVYSGGDPHPAFRFFLPLLPLVALDLAWIIDRCRSPLIGIVAVSVALLLTRQADISPGAFTIPNPASGLINTLQGHWPMDAVADDPQAKFHADAAQEMAEVLPPGIEIAATDVGALAFFSRLPILDTHGLNHAEISHLPKQKGVVNNWGNYRLDYLIDKDVALVHLHFPGHRSWSFKDVISSPKRCDFHAARVSRMAAPYIDELAENYLCLSIPSQSQENRWLNMFMHKDRSEILLTMPQNTQSTSCIRQFRKVCSPLG